MSDATEPVFDVSGKYLYFFVSTDAGPVNQWFAQSNADMRATQSLYLAVLKKGLPSPLTRESDEEKGTEEKGTKKGTDPWFPVKIWALSRYPSRGHRGLSPFWSLSSVPFSSGQSPISSQESCLGRSVRLPSKPSAPSTTPRATGR